jgi:hypothetical protein
MHATAPSSCPRNLTDSSLALPVKQVRHAAFSAQIHCRSLTASVAQVSLIRCGGTLQRQFLRDGHLGQAGEIQPRAPFGCILWILAQGPQNRAPEASPDDRDFVGDLVRRFDLI